MGGALPSDVADLWSFVTALDRDSLLDLLAHCTAQTVNAVKTPWERKTRQLAAADTLAEAVNLDMTAHWTPTNRSFFGRVTKAHISEAVREAVSPEAAERITRMKKTGMAEAAEQIVAGTGWLPPILRTSQRVEIKAEGTAPTDPSEPVTGVSARGEAEGLAAEAQTADHVAEIQDEPFAIAAE